MADSEWTRSWCANQPDRRPLARLVPQRVSAVEQASACGPHVRVRRRPNTDADSSHRQLHRLGDRIQHVRRSGRRLTTAHPLPRHKAQTPRPIRPRRSPSTAGNDVTSNRRAPNLQSPSGPVNLRHHALRLRGAGRHLDHIVPPASVELLANACQKGWRHSNRIDTSLHKKLRCLPIQLVDDIAVNGLWSQVVNDMECTCCRPASASR